MVNNVYKVGDIVVLVSKPDQVMRVASFVPPLPGQSSVPKWTCEFESDGKRDNATYDSNSITPAWEAEDIRKKLSLVDNKTIITSSDMNGRVTDFKKGLIQLEKVGYTVKTDYITSTAVFHKEGELPEAEEVRVEIYNPYFGTEAHHPPA